MDMKVSRFGTRMTALPWPLSLPAYSGPVNFRPAEILFRIGGFIEYARDHFFLPGPRVSPLAQYFPALAILAAIPNTRAPETRREVRKLSEYWFLTVLVVHVMWAALKIAI